MLHTSDIKCPRCFGRGTMPSGYVMNGSGVKPRSCRTCPTCNGHKQIGPGQRGYDYHLDRCKREGREPNWV